MKYSELIEKYKSGELDEVSAGEVSRDIEKHEAISDYLAERDDIPELSGLRTQDEKGSGAADGEAAGFAKKIRKQIRRSFLKAGFITGLIVLGIVLFIVCAIPRIIDRANYDPTEAAGYIKDDSGSIMKDCPTNRLSLDISVFSELFLPGNFRQEARATSLGSGKYSVTIHQNFSRSGNFRDAAGIINRGKLTLYDPNLLKLPVANIFETDLLNVKFEIEGSDRLEIQSFMYPDEVKRAYLTFDIPMSYTEAIEWCKKNGVAPEWGAICTGDEVKPCVYYGAKFTLDSIIQGYDYEKYPYLSVFSLAEQTPTAQGYATEELMKQHIISLLNYCADNPEGMRLFHDANELEHILAGCRESAEYISENGFSVYGIMFTGTVDEIKTVSELNGVKHIYVENIN